MRTLSSFPALALFLLALVPPAIAPAAGAVSGLSCLATREARAAVAQGKALTLARIRRVLADDLEGDMLRARLCERDEHLVYVLTLLHRSGKVRVVVVNAASGEEEGRE